jgi:hypothetical protein
METLLKILEEKLLVIEKLELRLIEMEKLLQTEKDSKIFWFAEFSKLEKKFILNPKENE